MFARVVISACCLLAFGFNGFTQAPNLTALKNRLQNSKPDTARLNNLLQISAYYNDLPKPSATVNQALNYAGAAEKLSVSLTDYHGLGKSYTALAKAWRNNKDSARAKAYLLKAKTVFADNHFYREAAEVVLNMEEFYQYFGGTDMKVRIAYYEQALPLFQQSPAKDRQEATLKVLGDFYQVQGNYPKALNYLQQALLLSGYIKTADRLALYDLLGAVYVMLGNLNQALAYGLMAVKMTEDSKDISMQACAVYNRVGITYYQMKQPRKARPFFEKSLAIAVKQGDIQTQINEYVNIAHVLISLGEFNKCILLLKDVIKKYPPAEVDGHTGVDHSLLKCYTRIKMFKEAKIYADRMEIAGAKNNLTDNEQQITQSLLAEYYVATLQDQPARKHLSFLKKISAAQHNPVALAIAFTLEAKLDSAQSKYASAYKNYRRASKLKDSVWNENQSRQVAQLQIQFETEKKDQQLKVKEDRIKLLNNQARLQQINLAQEKTTQKLIIAGAVLLVILLGLSYNGYCLKQRINLQLQLQRKEIDRKNQSLTSLVAQKDGLLEEKEWLMKEIHHRVKNNLQIVISLLSTQSNYLDNDIAYNAIRESQHRMQSISLIHQKLYQSDNLALVDIHAYIADLVDYLRESFDTGNRIEFELDVTHAEFDVTRSVPLGLILNEAITNSIKYAFPRERSGKITIALKLGPGNLFVLTIHDNGVGFPPEVDLYKSKSLGMSLMRGLSKQLGGNLKIENNDGISIVVEFIDEKLLKAV